MLQGCPGLVALYLYNTKGLPQAVMAPKAQHLSNLEVLEMDHLEASSASLDLPVNLRHLRVHRFTEHDTRTYGEESNSDPTDYFHYYYLNHYSLQVLMSSLQQLTLLHLSAIDNCYFNVLGASSSSLRSLYLEGVAGLPLGPQGVLDLRGLSDILTRVTVRECTGVKSVDVTGCRKLAKPVDFVRGDSRRRD
jgi:hypothetical protein